MKIAGMLEGKTAIVTGGTRGIGYEIVKKFVEAGAKVALFGSRQETVDKALAKLKEEMPEAEVMGLCPALDRYEEVVKAINTVKEAFGRVDILANNAGISARESLYDYKPEDFEKIMRLNVNAVFFCTKAVAPIMKEQGGGSVINTSSMVSIYGQAAGCGYPASKFAVNGLTKSLARSLARNSTAFATSSGSPTLPRGIPAEILCTISSGSAATISVLVTPGATALTRILSLRS